MKYQYVTVQNQFTCNEEEYTSYGIALLEVCENSTRALETVSDLSQNETEIQNLVSLFNREELAPEHFKEAIYDALIG